MHTRIADVTVMGRVLLLSAGCGAALLACASDASRGERNDAVERDDSDGSDESAADPFDSQRTDAGTPRVPVAPTPQDPADATDEGPCGDGCMQTDVGVDGDAFDLEQSSGSAVELDDEGALIVTREVVVEDSFIWVADTGASPAAVSKIDTRTREVVARYEVGAPDPSRTSVAMTGDAYVTSRSGMGITKFSAAGQDCPDTNGDGMVTTSTGPGDVLPFGEDDCMLWYRQFDQEIRAVAAQDIPGTTTIEEQLDGPPLITTTPSQHYVWLGASTRGAADPSSDPQTEPLAMAYKLDGETGEILLETAMPRGAYGFALDGRGILWLTGGAYWSGSVAFIDTNQCTDTATCDVEPCRTTCSTTQCPDTCDGAIKGDITLEPQNTYGITVDCKQRVWLGASPIKRYDPLAPVDQRLAVATGDAASAYAAGIAADANGSVWGAATPVVRLDAEDLTQVQMVDTPSYAHGVAVDVDGKVWAVTMNTTLHVIEPGATLADNVVTGDAVDGLQFPYTYSDMTGVQQQLAAAEAPGIYTQVFEGCAEGEQTTWLDFSWDAETPAASRVVFQVRTADTLEGLEEAEFQGLVAVPSMRETVDLDATLTLSGEPAGRYVEIQVELYADVGMHDRCSETPVTSPRVRAFTLAHRCPPGEPVLD